MACITVTIVKSPDSVTMDSVTVAIATIHSHTSIKHCRLQIRSVVCRWSKCASLKLDIVSIKKDKLVCDDIKATFVPSIYILQSRML